MLCEPFAWHGVFEAFLEEILLRVALLGIGQLDRVACGPLCIPLTTVCRATLTASCRSFATSGNKAARLELFELRQNQIFRSERFTDGYVRLLTPTHQHSNCNGATSPFGSCLAKGTVIPPSGKWGDYPCNRHRKVVQNNVYMQNGEPIMMSQGEALAKCVESFRGDPAITEGARKAIAAAVAATVAAKTGNGDVGSLAGRATDKAIESSAIATKVVGEIGAQVASATFATVGSGILACYLAGAATVGIGKWLFDKIEEL